MEDYSKQVLRVVVAQVCQAIGWHTIQSTPLELLTDILHKYMQELSVRTFRYTQLYSRTEANLDDVGLAFRDVGINVPDLLDYINNVDSVPCAVDVPRYPLKKESNLNFLKPGSKEVITRPVHVHEHLPPIHPEKEDDCSSPQEQSTAVPNPVHASVDPSSVITDITNVTANSVNIINNNKSFKKPELSEVTNLIKKPRVLHEDEGRPTREISSVMMTSSGFISPAREGKLPDSKAPIIPEYKPVRPATPPPSKVPIAATHPIEIVSSPNNFPEVKLEKKSRKQKASVPGVPNVEIKEQRKRERHLAKFQKRRGNSTDNAKTPNKKPKMREKAKHNANNSFIPPALMGSSLELPTPLESFPPVSLPADLTIKSETVLASPGNAANVPLSALSMENSLTPNAILSSMDIKPPPNIIDEIKLSSAPDKQKYNIFKKISAKKSREESQKGSANTLSSNDFISGLLTLPESTTIRRLPPMKFDSPPHTDPNVIVVDDDTPPRPSSPFELSERQMLSIPSLPAGTTATTSAALKSPYFDNSLLNMRQPSTIIEPPKKQQRKPRKNKQQVLVEQSAPLNLSNESTVPKDFPINDNSALLEPAKPPRKRMNKVGRPSKRANTKMAGIPGNTPFPTAVGLPPMRSDSLKRDLSPLSMFKGGNNQFLSGMHRYPYINPFHLLGGPGLIPNPSFMHPSGNPLLAFRNPFGYNDLMGLRPPLRPPKIEEAKPVSPPPSIPLDLENNVYCNVPPLVPDSLKLQLSPALLSRGSKLPTSSAITPPASRDSFGSVKGVKMENQNFSMYHTAAPVAGNKPSKVFDAPIEISDDEKSMTKSDTETEKPIHSPKTPSEGSNNNTATCILENPSSYNKNSNVPRSTEIKPVMEVPDGTDNVVQTNLDQSDVIVKEKSSSEIDVLDLPGEVNNPNSKGDKKRDKEHKKGKRGKDGKIKKKKDKKDKTKNKEKADKRKEEKKEKDRSKKKKEKRKEKLQKTKPCPDVVTSPEKPAINSTSPNDPAATANSSMVPKLTLKFGSPDSIGSEDSPETRKLMKSFNGGEESIDDGAIINERRESSPELARISPLVTRPPKQKISTNTVTSTMDGIIPTQLNVDSKNHLQQFSTLLEKWSNSPKNFEQQFNELPSEELNSCAIICKDSLPPPITVTDANREAKVSPSLNLSSVQERNFNDIDTISTAQPKNLDSNNFCSPCDESYHEGSFVNINEPAVLEATPVIRPSSYIDAEGNQVWICPACGKVDDGTPMIGCDGCDAWYHWVCVGIQVPPDECEDWYCRNCIIKKQEANYYDKKKKRKKKNKTT